MTEQSAEHRESLKRYLQDRYEMGTTAGEGAKSIARMRIKRLLTWALLPLQHRKARHIVAELNPIQLHLGCGDIYLEGWVNIDLARPGRAQDLDWNLARPLPFPKESVTAVFSEHTLEHMSFSAAYSLLQECFRVLKPGGTLRLSVPDLEYFVDNYKGSSDSVTATSAPTRGMTLNELFYFHGHRAIYDYETLSAFVRASGFDEVHRSSFGVSTLGVAPDLPQRKHQSLYVEATK